MKEAVAVLHHDSDLRLG